MEVLKEFRDAMPILSDGNQLRERMTQDGYLFFRRLLPEDEVLAVRRDIIRLCQDKGWVDETERASSHPRWEGSDDYWEVYDALQCLESFHALAHRPELKDIVYHLVQEEVFVHPRNIARITFPNVDQSTTPPHQDYVHIQGTTETYTAWIPLGFCPVELGGLAVLAGSHRYGLLSVHPAVGPGNLAVRVDNLEGDWLTTDYEPGDVLIFHSLTVHRALPNRSQDQLRLSVDYRYQGLSQPICDGALQPHYGRLTWDQIYKGWQRQELMYYWEGLPLHLVPYDPSCVRLEQV
ncbi:MAG: phytanoyl-CoA dioxygenase family protein [Armatimonadetes bacterium]|nr:phytanoyl-CoA dioxygenase family protein [Armatimonadota bacterium]MDW8122509.1 phytanoyl-CoA dioxygenase family protein [Armatimonadota bacterium]